LAPRYPTAASASIRLLRGKTRERGFTDSLRSELIHDGSKVHVTMVQLPALNTPQFGWVKSRLPRKAQPVPPIFQPEVAAEAIYWAAHQKRREVFVGVPTFKAIAGNKIAPGILDHYLASAAYDGQQTDEPEDPNRPHNLMEPLPGDHGAHGTFDKRATDSSPAFWAVKHRAALGAVAGGFFAVACAAVINTCFQHSD
jgi:hypothetical protein